jgi:hypothetical protein
LQCCGSGIRSVFGQLDPEGQKSITKIEKSAEIFCFEMVDVLLLETEAVLRIRIGFNADPDRDPAAFFVNPDPDPDPGF